MDTKKITEIKKIKNKKIKSFGSNPYFQFQGDYFYRREFISK